MQGVVGAMIMKFSTPNRLIPSTNSYTPGACSPRPPRAPRDRSPSYSVRRTTSRARRSSPASLHPPARGLADPSGAGREGGSGGLVRTPVGAASRTVGVGQTRTAGRVTAEAIRDDFVDDFRLYAAWRFWSSLDVSDPTRQTRLRSPRRRVGARRDRRFRTRGRTPIHRRRRGRRPSWPRCGVESPGRRGSCASATMNPKRSPIATGLRAPSRASRACVY